MKKSLMLVMLGILSFLGINSVSASTTLNNYYDNYVLYSTLEDNYADVLNNLTTYYANNYASDYPYYFIWADNNYIRLKALKDNSFYDYSHSGLYPNNNSESVSYSYNIDSSSYSTSDYSTFYNTLLYYSNVSFTFVDSKHCSANISSDCNDSIIIPSYSNSDLNITYSEFYIKNNYKLPTYKSLVNNTYNPAPDFTDSMGMDINDFFEKPLEALRTVWGAISSIFNLITEFIVLLPPAMQGFLFLAFGITIILGIIKILL